MSERSPEADIQPRCVNVADVPWSDIADAGKRLQKGRRARSAVCVGNVGRYGQEDFETMWTNPRRWVSPNLVDLYDHARFELKTALGRMLSKKSYHFPNLQYLHLGCGEHILPEFLNTDSFANPKAQLGVDLRFQLPFPNASWRGIYAHHVLEHIPYESAQTLLRECHRVLKQGGVLRLVVPDAEKFVRAYSQKSDSDRKEMFGWYPPWHMKDAGITTPMQMINLVFRDVKFNRHEYAWDFDTLEFNLREAGFTRVTRSSLNQSLDIKLAGHDNPNWEAHSLYVEAVR